MLGLDDLFKPKPMKVLLGWRRAIVLLLSALFIVFGLMLFGGGVWLISLGGSFYYVIAGIGLVISGGLLARRNSFGAVVYVAVFAGTVLWSYAEVGSDGWALLPRLGGPSLLLVALLLIMPLLRPADYLRPLRVLAVSALLFAAFLFSSPPWSVAPRRASAPRTGLSGNSVDLDWPAYGGTNRASRYSSAQEITRDNIGRLEQVWEFHTGDLPPKDVSYAFENTPLKIADSLYVCTPSQIVIALDPATGREKWRFNPHVSQAAMSNIYNATCRGVAYFESAGPDLPCRSRILFGTTDARLIAIDASTGRLCTEFGDRGSIDLTRNLGPVAPGFVAVTSAPLVIRNIVIVGHQVRDNQTRDAPSGVVRAFDASTGAPVWAWDIGRPNDPTPLREGEVYTRGTPNVWTNMSADQDLGLVFLPTGAPAADYFGANRTEEEEKYANALVALDAATGQVRWSFQAVHHDLWDYDLAAQATMAELPLADRAAPVVIVPTKQGQIFILDRRTGEPVVPVHEVPVPQGAAPGDFTAPTQPVSVNMPDLAGPPLREADTWGVSPLDQLLCRIRFRQARYDGPFTPPSLQGSITFPGYNGGIDWGGVAVDERRGVLIVNYNRLANLNQLISREAVQRLGIRALGEPGSVHGGPAQLGTPYGVFAAPWMSRLNVPCMAPPWGFIGAIDLKTGRFNWRKPLGTPFDSGPSGIPTRLKIPMGVPNNGGAVVTAGGLTFIAASLDRFLRAFDTETGEQLWEARLSAGGQATPISYVSHGRQFIVIAAGGHGSMGTASGDSVVAYALH